MEMRTCILAGLAGCAVVGTNSFADITFGGDAGHGDPIGYDGVGWCSVDGGSEYRPFGGFGYIGHEATGHGTLTVHGSSSEVDSRILAIAERGQGNITVSAGAALLAGSRGAGPTRIANHLGSVGGIVVQNPGSFASLSSVSIGQNGGVGSVTVRDGAVVDGSIALHRGDIHILEGGVLNGFLSIGTYDARALFEGTTAGLLITGGGRFVGGGLANFGISHIDGAGSEALCTSVFVTSTKNSTTCELGVTDGAFLSASSFHISTHQFPGLGGELSQLVVRGSDSCVDVDDYFYVEAYGPSDARLFIDSGAKVRVGGDFELESLFSKGIPAPGSASISGNASMVTVEGSFRSISGNWQDLTNFIDFTPSASSDPIIHVLGDFTFENRAWIDDRDPNPGLRLEVSHNDDLVVSDGDRFPIITVEGQVLTAGEHALPRFFNFEEGDVVDTYNGIELRITYIGGDGNDIELYAIASETCVADLTGDGDLNFLDVSAFLTAFGELDPVADFELDGSFNFLDVSAFLAAFGAGCP